MYLVVFITVLQAAYPFMFWVVLAASWCRWQGLNLPWVSWFEFRFIARGNLRMSSR